MRNILVVDDSPLVRGVIRRIIEALGFGVVEAADGRQAIAACETMGVPDAIILDVIMPAMDGLECLRALRQDQRFQDCPIIMCTTRNEPEEIEAALAAGATEYIMKPFTDEILADKLRQVGLIA